MLRVLLDLYEDGCHCFFLIFLLMFRIGLMQEPFFETSVYSTY